MKQATKTNLINPDLNDSQAAALSLASLASFSFNHLTLLANASLPNLFLIKLTQSTVPVE